MELCESEILGFIDDDSVCVEEVDSVFDNRRREEDIVHTEFEFHDAVFEFVGRKLSVGDDDFCLGDE